LIADLRRERAREILSEMSVPQLAALFSVLPHDDMMKMMAEAGVSIAYRAKPVVRSKADYALDHAGLDGVLNLFA